MASIWNDYYTEEELERYRQMNAPQIFDMNQPLPPTDLKYPGAVNAEMIPGENLLYQQARDAGIPEEAIMLGSTVLSKKPVITPKGPKQIGGPVPKKVEGVRVDQTPGTKVNKPIVQTVNMPKRNIFESAADYIRKNPKKSLFTAASTAGVPYLASNIQDSNVVNKVADSLYGADGKGKGASQQDINNINNTIKEQPTLWQNIQDPDWWMNPVQGGAGGWDNRLFRLGEMMTWMGTPLNKRGDSPAKRWQLAQKNAMDAAKGKVKKPPTPLKAGSQKKYIIESLDNLAGSGFSNLWQGMSDDEIEAAADVIDTNVFKKIRQFELKYGEGKADIQAIVDYEINKYLEANE